MKKMKMEYKKAMANDTGRIVSLVHHTIMTVYPQYYPEKVVDFFCGLHCEKNIRRDVECWHRIFRRTAGGYGQF